jgi:hypothetical protein
MCIYPNWTINSHVNPQRLMYFAQQIRKANEMTSIAYTNATGLAWTTLKYKISAIILTIHSIVVFGNLWHYAKTSMARFEAPIPYNENMGVTMVYLESWSMIRWPHHTHIRGFWTQSRDNSDTFCRPWLEWFVATYRHCWPNDSQRGILSSAPTSHDW